ncbi:hypothetical protein H4R34_002529 [Dimargaris verticillata]|uniref:Uncharacterized protein n=1 Tax=Dimargaris verticillata TaxID=2761393 RepID=A0A9W8B1M9_9FUNG|nr:hypothetical protein H4R34_002529 [Dimargaris verticillata]
MADQADITTPMSNLFQSNLTMAITSMALTVFLHNTYIATKLLHANRQHIYQLCFLQSILGVVANLTNLVTFFYFDIICDFRIYFSGTLNLTSTTAIEVILLIKAYYGSDPSRTSTRAIFVCGTGLLVARVAAGVVNIVFIHPFITAIEQCMGEIFMTTGIVVVATELVLNFFLSICFLRSIYEQWRFVRSRLYGALLRDGMLYALLTALCSITIIILSFFKVMESHTAVLFNISWAIASKLTVMQLQHARHIKKATRPRTYPSSQSKGSQRTSSARYTLPSQGTAVESQTSTATWVRRVLGRLSTSPTQSSPQSLGSDQSPRTLENGASSNPNWAVKVPKASTDGTQPHAGIIGTVRSALKPNPSKGRSLSLVRPKGGAPSTPGGSRPSSPGRSLSPNYPTPLPASLIEPTERKSPDMQRYSASGYQYPTAASSTSTLERAFPNNTSSSFSPATATVAALTRNRSIETSDRGTNSANGGGSGGGLASYGNEGFAQSDSRLDRQHRNSYFLQDDITPEDRAAVVVEHGGYEPCRMAPSLDLPRSPSPLQPPHLGETADDPQH